AFCWLALKNACSTQDNLSKRRFQLANRCYLCNCSSETANHMFIHCLVATDLWFMFLSLFGLQWVKPSNIREVFVSWILGKLRNLLRRSGLWFLLLFCGVYGLKGIKDVLMVHQLQALDLRPNV
ncbi:hypothetical protein MTR67_048685, partial [Solanum verrucosum]